MRSKGLIPRFVKIINDKNLNQFVPHEILEYHNKKYRGSPTTLLQVVSILRCYNQFEHVGITKINSKDVYVYSLKGGIA